MEGIGKHAFALTPGRYVGAEEQEEDGEPFFPRAMWKDALLSMVLIVLIAVLAVTAGAAALGPQADPTLPALSAVYRWLEQNDLDAQGRRYLLRQNIPGPTKAFEAPGVNDLWIVDFSPGPFLSLHPRA